MKKLMIFVVSLLNEGTAMKKLFLVLFMFVAMTSFAQLQVKEGSFKHVLGGVIEDKVFVHGGPFANIARFNVTYKMNKH